jgi:polyisoprenoid-binding protein YceI
MAQPFVGAAVMQPFVRAAVMQPFARVTVRQALGALVLCVGLAIPAARADMVLADRSEIAFTMKQMGVKFDGRFRKWKADVVWKPSAPAQSRAQVDVDLASVDLASGDSEAEARGPLWFDTAKFPVAHFSSTSIRDLGGNRYEVTGTLSLKGIARDYVVPITVSTDASGHRVAEGTFPVRRLQHKVGEGEWADTATVADDVVVRVRLVLAPG